MVKGPTKKPRKGLYFHLYIIISAINTGETMEDDQFDNERLRKERIKIFQRLEEEKYREALYSFLNGDIFGV